MAPATKRVEILETFTGYPGGVKTRFLRGKLMSVPAGWLRSACLVEKGLVAVQASLPRRPVSAKTSAPDADEATVGQPNEREGESHTGSGRRLSPTIPKDNEDEN